MSTYEGQYEPKDSRDVTLSNERAPGEPDRTGHREGETRQQKQQDIATDGAKNGTKGGGNAVGETSAEPAARAKADGNRPISGD